MIFRPCYFYYFFPHFVSGVGGFCKVRKIPHFFLKPSLIEKPTCIFFIFFYLGLVGDRVKSLMEKSINFFLILSLADFIILAKLKILKKKVFWFRKVPNQMLYQTIIHKYHSSTSRFSSIIYVGKDLHINLSMSIEIKGLFLAYQSKVCLQLAVCLQQSINSSASTK